MNRRDLLLSEMGITQWQLTNPTVLKGDAQICLEKTVKLVVVCEENYQKTAFFADFLRTISVNVAQYRWMNEEQIQRLIIDHSLLIWIIGGQQADKIRSLFANQSFISTACWADLTTVEHKRKLWKALEKAHQVEALN